MPTSSRPLLVNRHSVFDDVTVSATDRLDPLVRGCARWLTHLQRQSTHTDAVSVGSPLSLMRVVCQLCIALARATEYWLADCSEHLRCLTEITVYSAWLLRPTMHEKLSLSLYALFLFAICCSIHGCKKLILESCALTPIYRHSSSSSNARAQCCRVRSVVFLRLRSAIFAANSYLVT